MLTQDALQQLRNGSLDLAFVGLPLDAGALAARTIALEQLGATVPVDHPLAERPAVGLAELADDGLVTMRAGAGTTLREAIFAACAAAGSGRGWHMKSRIRTPRCRSLPAESG